MDPGTQDSNQAQNFTGEMIRESIRVWEEYNFKDQDLWEAYKENFEG